MTNNSFRTNQWGNVMFQGAKEYITNAASVFLSEIQMDRLRLSSEG